MGLSVVILESDTAAAQSLAEKLSPQFSSIHIVNSCEELRNRVANCRPEAALLNMEQARLSDVRDLHCDFPAIPIICLHRVPDEQLWVDALDAGAVDVCGPDDAVAVLAAVLRSMVDGNLAA